MIRLLTDLAIFVMPLAAQPPPRILQIYRDIVKPGAEAGYAATERDLARACAEFGFPHDYLAVESRTGRKEVWFFNAWESEEEQREVAEAYQRNAPLVAALEAGGRRKASLVAEAIEAFGHYQPELSRGEPWTPGRGRFLAIAITKGVSRLEGTVFEADDGLRFVISAAATLAEAQARAAAAGAEARVFAVRPEWSKPAAEWTAADPGFWRA